eukprot:PhM_4_TR10396/c0_g1_i1/m.87377
MPLGRHSALCIVLTVLERRCTRQTARQRRLHTLDRRFEDHREHNTKQNVLDDVRRGARHNVTHNAGHHHARVQRDAHQALLAVLLGEVLRSQRVAQLRDAVRRAGVVVVLLHVRVRIDERRRRFGRRQHELTLGADKQNAPTVAATEEIFDKQVRQQKWTHVVRAELRLETIGRLAPRARHDTCVVDEQIQRQRRLLAVPQEAIAQFRDERLDGGTARNVEGNERDGAGGCDARLSEQRLLDVVDRLHALFLAARGHDDVCAVLDERPARLEPYAAVAAGDDDALPRHGLDVLVRDLDRLGAVHGGALRTVSEEPPEGDQRGHV